MIFKLAPIIFIYINKSLSGYDDIANIYNYNSKSLIKYLGINLAKIGKTHMKKTIQWKIDLTNGYMGVYMCLFSQI